jgi:AAHS family 4-hydroxybenzoate transporter-like MFS transporter
MVATVLTSSAEDSRLTAPVVVLTVICSLIYFLDGLIHSVLGPLAPGMASALQLGNTELGPIFSANLLGQCIGLVVFPIIASRMGQRSIVILSVVGFGLGQSGSALATGATDLFAWRLVTGVFLGGCLPSCLAIVTAAAPTARRGLAIMTLFMGYGAGATAAGLVVVALGDWRVVMVAVGAACLLTAAGAWRWLRIPAPARVDPENEGGHSAFGIVSPQYLVGTLMLWLLFIAMLTISYCLNSWLPTLLVEVGRDASLAAISVSIFSFGGIAAALVIGVLIDRLGAMRTLISFVTISAALLFLVGQVLASASTEVLLTALGACGFFVLGAYGGVNVVLASYYPDALRAVGIGWAKSVGRIGTVIAPVLIGLGLSAGIAGTTVMSAFALPALVAVLSLVALAALMARRAG